MKLNPMSVSIESLSILLLLANGLVSYLGFTKVDFFNRRLFWVDGVLRYREYDRLFTSGFLHTNWLHLVLNMYVLYEFSKFFSYGLFSPVFYLVLYFGSLLGGNLLALFIRRYDGSYRAVGASGAVSGLLFAFSVYAPWSKIYLFFIIPVWPWLFALFYIAFSIYGIRTRQDNIGHEAHLGGAITGLLITLLFDPSLFLRQPVIITLLLLPTALFLYLIATRPDILLRSFSRRGFSLSSLLPSRRSKVITVKRGGESSFSSREEEINYLLDKGYERLSAKEKARLKELSEK